MTALCRVSRRAAGVHYDRSGASRGHAGRGCEVVVGVPMRLPLRRKATATAVWAAALERYRRSVDRFLESLRLMPERSVRTELVRLGGPLEAVLEDFEEASARRAHYDASTTDWILEHMRRAATLCSHATETALLVNQAAWRHDADEVARGIESVRQLVTRIDELGDEVRRAG